MPQRFKRRLSYWSGRLHWTRVLWLQLPQKIERIHQGPQPKHKLERYATPRLPQARVTEFYIQPTTPSISFARARGRQLLRLNPPLAPASRARDSTQQYLPLISSPLVPVTGEGVQYSVPPGPPAASVFRAPRPDQLSPPLATVAGAWDAVLPDSSPLPTAASTQPPQRDVTPPPSLSPVTQLPAVSLSSRALPTAGAPIPSAQLDQPPAHASAHDASRSLSTEASLPIKSTTSAQPLPVSLPILSGQFSPQDLGSMVDQQEACLSVRAPWSIGILIPYTDELTTSSWNYSPTSTSEPSNRIRLSISFKPCTKAIPGISQLCLPCSWRSSSNRCRSSMHHPDLPLNLPLLLLLLPPPPPPPKICSQDPRLYSDLAGPCGSSSDNVLVAESNIKCIGITENTRYVVVSERAYHLTVAFWASRALRKHYSSKVAQAEPNPLRAMLTPSPSSGSHTTACTTAIPLSSTIIGKGGVRNAIGRLGLRERCSDGDTFYCVR